MPVLDKILDSALFSNIWKEVIARAGKGKLVQLITLKPISVYKGQMNFELDETQLTADIDASIENLLQKPIQRAFDLFSLDFKSATDFSYHIKVDVLVKMNYANIRKYLNQQFANEQYWILDDRVGLTFYDFNIQWKDNHLSIDIPMKIDAKYKRLKYSGNAEVTATGRINYYPNTKQVKIERISYVATSDKWILRLVNLVYYFDIKEALEDFLQFDISNELVEGLKKLQKEVENFNKEELSILEGEVSSINLKKINFDPNGGSAYILVEGRAGLLDN
ncbi:MAG: DUF4403 family protein [Chitinophagales bacterium]|nr:DUF4403 family protein [Chitinophagales bacterium]